VQGGQVANQSRIFALRGAARRNTAYMTCAFLGGSVGSWLGVRAYSEFGWGGIAGLTALASAAALTRHLAHRRSAGAAPASQAQETSAAAADQVSCP
jgi:hypothetical protein